MALAQRLEALGEAPAHHELRRQPRAERGSSRPLALEDVGADLDPARLLPRPVVERHPLERRRRCARSDARAAATCVGARARATSGAGSIGSPTTTRARERKRPRSSKTRPTGTIAHARAARARARPRARCARRRCAAAAVAAVVADPLGEDRDRRAARQLLDRAGERLAVARGVGALVLPAVDRNDAGEVEQLGGGPGSSRACSCRACAPAGAASRRRTAGRSGR